MFGFSCLGYSTAPNFIGYRGAYVVPDLSVVDITSPDTHPWLNIFDIQSRTYQLHHMSSIPTLDMKRAVGTTTNIGGKLIGVNVIIGMYHMYMLMSTHAYGALVLVLVFECYACNGMSWVCVHFTCHNPNMRMYRWA